MTERSVHVSRWKVGLIAITLLLAAVVVRVGYPDETLLLGALVRVGFLMSAIWLAMPAGGRPAAWSNLSTTSLVGFGVAILAIVRPRAFLPLLPIVVVLGVLSSFAPRPRDAKNRRRTR